MNTKQVWISYSEDLKRFINSKIKDHTIADDILQDTFIKIHTKLHTLKDTTKLKAWCFAVARNSILDYWKSKNSTFNIADLHTETQVGKTTSEVQENSHTEEDCLKQILKNLPIKYRKPLFLSDIKGLKQQEVADQLHQSLSTTKSQIQRARKLIAQGFIDCCGFVLNKKGNLVGEIQEKADCKICN
ncbi:MULTISPECIES: sigma-70 family RNA polymerase sigma factor [unclassified Polaribacter]|uniref:sigma-70 family RNA polymerase sigma factor n=1 Tax=unclassified Polaribacter TaxID=196858 RepID=UPI0011BF287A|nr:MULTISPECIES: sigma-70 family RNA polymerase sigma factor [unclassified Polaribacter]TXD53952.1 sigma-70 family RNA polymerase sigma factor [Polaribacter sp. IC063]TXD59661.1 sigma-70 family RNA polymerase sigma factor [Polaribacter sp. IC066]